MDITEILKYELSAITNGSKEKILFNLILLIWLISIPAKNSVYQVSVILIPLFFVYHAILNKDSILSLRRFFVKYIDFIAAFLVIILAMTVSNLQSVLSNSESWGTLLKYLSRYFLVLISLLYLYEYKMFTRRVLVIFSLAELSAYCIHGCYQLIFISKGAESVQSIVYNRIPFGFIMFTGLILSSYSGRYLTESSNGSGIVLIKILMALFLICLLFSFSRTAWVGALLFFGLLFVNRNNVFMQHRKTIILIIILIFSLIYFNAGLYGKFYDLVRIEDSHRFSIWSNAYILIKENILFGYGLIEYESIGLPEFHGVHNSTLEIMLFMGIAGLIAFTTVTVLTIKEIISRKHYEYLPVIISFFAISQFNFSVLSNKIFLSTLAVFLFFVLSHRADQK